MHLGGSNVKVVGLLASGRRRRKLRTDLRVSQQVIAGDVTYVVKIPETGEYLRLPEFEWETLCLFDGSRTDKEVWEELHRRHDDLEMTVTELEDYADNTDPNVWEKTLTEKNLALLEKMRTERSERSGDENIFYMYFSAWDPDKFFNRVIPYLRWIWSRPSLYFTLAVFAVAIVLFMADFDRVMQDTLKFYNFREKTLAEFVDFWILLFLVGFSHESAHGLTCKNYGGEVHQMGFLLLYFSPAFYVDVSDMYLFDEDNKRFWTVFSGLYSTGFLGALGMIAWYFTIPGTFANDWAYKFVLMCSITTIIMNLNPLMKYDGYYALCQWLKIDNLLEDSVPYLRQWVVHYLSSGRAPVERVSRRKHRIYLIYASLHVLYANFVVLVILLFVRNVTVSTMGIWGWLVTAVAAWFLLGDRVIALGRLLAVAVKHGKEAIMRWQASWQTKAVAATALALLLLPPVATKVTTDFVLEPGARAEVRATVAGTVAEVRVREGQEIAAGSVLAVLRSPEAEA
ncbi:MAG: biotin/lipoyl-binding protein, partial [Candidatus Acidiferrales bacterium]